MFQLWLRDSNIEHAYKANKNGQANIYTFSLQVPGGIGMAVAIRIGQELGAGRPIHAKTASRVGYTITSE